MLRKFTLATFAVAALIWLGGLTSGPTPSASAQPDENPITNDAVNDLLSIPDGKPAEEIIEFWRERSNDHPFDYISRTELGYGLIAHAAGTADLDLYREGETAFLEALELNNQYDSARLGLASTLSSQHRFGEAIEQISAADNSDSAPALAILGDALLGFGDYDEAAVVYQQLIEAERSAPTVSRLARLRSFQGQPDVAVEFAREAVTLSDGLSLRRTDRAFYRFQLGHFLFQAGDVERSTALYLEALEFDPIHPGASENLAFNLAASGDLEAAALRYEELIERSPAADLHGLYADVLTLLGRDDEAYAQERLASEAAIEGLDEPAERRHLVSYFVTRDPEMAVELAETDLEERHDVGAYDSLAWALFHAGDIDEASAMIDSALVNGSSNASILYHAAAIAEAGGDRESAADFLEEALEINQFFHPTEGADARELAERIAG